MWGISNFISSSLFLFFNYRSHQSLFTFTQELLHNLFNLVTAGFETTAHTLSSSMYFLSRYPHLQSAIRDATNLSNDSLTERCPQNLVDTTCDRQSRNSKVVRAVIKESLRLLPPVLQIKRTSTTPTKVGSFFSPGKFLFFYLPQFLYFFLSFRSVFVCVCVQ